MAMSLVEAIHLTSVGATDSAGGRRPSRKNGKGCTIIAAGLGYSLAKGASGVPRADGKVVFRRHHKLFAAAHLSGSTGAVAELARASRREELTQTGG